MGEAVIQLESISKAFESRKVLKGVCVLAEKGESLFLCGVNGVGKSTLLRIISGLLEADDGSVQLCGYDMRKDPERGKPQLGVISHKSMVYLTLTVSENLLFFANLYGVKNAKARVKELIEKVGLGVYRDEQAQILSRGLLQRLAIARALVHRPTVLLADEPFTGLDNESCSLLMGVVSDFVNDGGTIVMTTHDAYMGLKCCNRVAVLDNGRTDFQRNTSEIDAGRFAEDYVGYARGEQ